MSGAAKTRLNHIAHPAVQDAMATYRGHFDMADSARVDRGDQKYAQNAAAIHGAFLNFVAATPDWLRRDAVNLNMLRRLQAFAMWHETFPGLPLYLLGVSQEEKSAKLLLGNERSKERDRPRLYEAAISNKSLAAIEDKSAENLFRPESVDEAISVAQGHSFRYSAHNDEAIRLKDSLLLCRGFRLSSGPSYLGPKELVDTYFSPDSAPIAIEPYVGRLAVAFGAETQMSELMSILYSQEQAQTT